MSQAPPGEEPISNRLEIRRSGPPPSAWLTALLSVALAAFFVVVTATVRGIQVMGSISRLLAIAALTVLLSLTLFLLVLFIPWISPRVRRWSGFVMGLCLATAGVFHFLLLREHLQESTVLGLGFLTAGIAQVLLATVVIAASVQARESRRASYSVIALSAGLVFLYAVHVWLGLPLAGPASPGTLGGREEVDVPGTLTKLAELASLLLAFVTLVSFRRITCAPAAWTSGTTDDGSGAPRTPSGRASS